MQGKSTCSCCGKPLSDPISMALGIGPVCRINLKMREVNNMSGNLFSDRADYSYTVEGGVVCIVDHDNGKTVTNDAAKVIEDLVRDGVDLEANVVIYRDTQGIWDQLAVHDGRFADFKSVNERDKEAAKAKVLAAVCAPF